MAEADTDQNGQINAEEFLQHRAMRPFRSFDADDSGMLTVNEVTQGFSKLGFDELLKRDAAARFVDVADTNRDGKVDYQEFQVSVPAQQMLRLQPDSFKLPTFLWNPTKASKIYGGSSLPTWGANLHVFRQSPANFAALDYDSSNGLDIKEVTEGFSQLGLDELLKRDAASKFMAVADTNLDGKIDAKEYKVGFAKVLKPDAGGNLVVAESRMTEVPLLVGKLLEHHPDADIKEYGAILSSANPIHSVVKAFLENSHLLPPPFQKMATSILPVLERHSKNFNAQKPLLSNARVMLQLISASIETIRAEFYSGKDPHSVGTADLMNKVVQTLNDIDLAGDCNAITTAPADRKQAMERLRNSWDLLSHVLLENRGQLHSAVSTFDKTFFVRFLHAMISKWTADAGTCLSIGNVFVYAIDTVVEKTCGMDRDAETQPICTILRGVSFQALSQAVGTSGFGKALQAIARNEETPNAQQHIAANGVHSDELQRAALLKLLASQHIAANGVHSDELRHAELLKLRNKVLTIVSDLLIGLDETGYQKLESDVLTWIKEAEISKECYSWIQKNACHTCFEEALKKGLRGLLVTTGFMAGNQLGALADFLELDDFMKDYPPEGRSICRYSGESPATLQLIQLLRKDSKSAKQWSSAVVLRLALHMIADQDGLASDGIGKSPFATLGLPCIATKKDTKKRHRDLAKFLHPDKGGSLDVMSSINDAHDRIVQAESLPERLKLFGGCHFSKLYHQLTADLDDTEELSGAASFFLVKTLRAMEAAQRKEVTDASMRVNTEEHAQAIAAGKTYMKEFKEAEIAKAQAEKAVEVLEQKEATCQKTGCSTAEEKKTVDQTKLEAEKQAAEAQEAQDNWQKELRDIPANSELEADPKGEATDASADPANSELEADPKGEATDASADPANSELEADPKGEATDASADTDTSEVEETTDQEEAGKVHDTTSEGPEEAKTTEA